MDNLSLIGDIEKNFSNEFKGCLLTYKSAQLGKAIIHCFFAAIPSEESLDKNWIKISNSLALKFQNKLADDFEKWNMYLFYQLESCVSRDLHYQIENDTFSSRKIIIENQGNYEEIIREHILNSDIKIDMDTSIADDFFTYSNLIYDDIKDMKPKMRLGLEMELSLNNIIGKIKDLT